MWKSSNPAEFRSNNFGLIRLALAAFVVLAHSFAAVNGSNAGEPLYEFTGKRLDLGALAVNGFFIASGFMVSDSLAQGRGFGDFLRRRIYRLYPAYGLLWLIQSFVLAPLFSEGRFTGYSITQWGRLLYNLATLSSYGYPYGGLLRVFPHNPIPMEMNVSLWTLRYEFTCYLALALAGLLGLFRRRWLMTIIFLIAWSLFTLGIALPWHRVATALIADGAYWPRFATYFLAGVTFWHWRKQIPRSTPIAMAALGLTVIGLFLPKLINPVFPLTWTYLILWVAYYQSPRWQHFGSRSDISYGSYLYAFPIQQIVVYYFPQANPWQVLLLSLPTTLLAGLLSWHLVEKHFRIKLFRNQGRNPGLPSTP